MHLNRIDITKIICLKLDLIDNLALHLSNCTLKNNNSTDKLSNTITSEWGRGLKKRQKGERNGAHSNLSALFCLDIFINDMAQRMKVKFDKYWDSYNVVLACGVVLDPRYKLDFVDYIFRKIESNDLTTKMKLQHVRTQLY